MICVLNENYRGIQGDALPFPAGFSSLRGAGVWDDFLRKGRELDWGRGEEGEDGREGREGRAASVPAPKEFELKRTGSNRFEFSDISFSDLIVL